MLQDEIDITVLAAQMANRIGERFPCHSGYYGPVCQTGDQYVTIGQEGLRQEGKTFREYLLRRVGPPIPGTVRSGARPLTYGNAGNALDALMASFTEYAAWWLANNAVPEGRLPILYWRYAAPHIFGGATKRGRWRFNTRLVLSLKPVLWHSVEEYEQRNGSLSNAEQLQQFELESRGSHEQRDAAYPAA